MEFRTSIINRGSRIKRIKQPNGDQKEYKLKGGHFYRIHYVEASGRPRTVEHGPYRRVNDAKDAMKTRMREIEASGGRGQDRRKMTFEDLSAYCLNDGIYAEGSVRSRRTVQVNIKNLGKFFNRFQIKNISRESLREYKTKRLSDYRPTKEGAPTKHISEATVNRELATLRAMLFFAIGEGWITNNPFFKLRGLISTKGEIARERVLTRDEEVRLLAACEGTWTIPYERTRKGKKEQLTSTFTLNNKHLQAMIMIALDSSMRLGEILSLRWSDIDLEKNLINIRPETTKTAVGRRTLLSERGKQALMALPRSIGSDRPFPYVDIKRSFSTAKRLAKIEGLQFRDLRRTSITRRQEEGVSLAFAGKAAGHSQLQTTHKHYTVLDGDQLDAIRHGVDAANIVPETTELVN